MHSHGYAALSKSTPLEPFQFERREPGPTDIVIAIKFCGVCHSDIHQTRDEWGGSLFPMVPGHEIVGEVTAVGNQVTKFKVGDLAGVGCMVDSCGHCVNCDAGEEQFCQNGMVLTYNSKDKQGELVQGGYSNNIVVTEAFALKLSSKLDLAATAPLLCAGITTYSPIKAAGVKPGQKVGVVGLGGLGHMGLKFAHSFGAKVTQFTTSLNKKEDALRLGADEVILSKDPAAMAAAAGTFDFILDTVSAPHDMDQYLSLLKPHGRYTIVGVPEKPMSVAAFTLIMGNRSLSGSAIGGIAETQEMLDYCAEHNIVSDIELIPMQKINESYTRVVNSDVKYRFVIDMNSIA
ncbi:MAG TPA: NAD(P)-dependent alcohol dehydrogenase [Acidobacteriaceae bacterium]